MAAKYQQSNWSLWWKNIYGVLDWWKAPMINHDRHDGMGGILLPFWFVSLPLTLTFGAAIQTLIDIYSRKKNVLTDTGCFLANII